MVLPFIILHELDGNNDKIQAKGVFFRAQLSCLQHSCFNQNLSQIFISYESWALHETQKGIKARSGGKNWDYSRGIICFNILNFMDSITYHKWSNVATVRGSKCLNNPFTNVDSAQRPALSQHVLFIKGGVNSNCYSIQLTSIYLVFHAIPLRWKYDSVYTLS